MATALSVATVVIAFADTDDEHHERGREIVRAVDLGELPIGVVTNDALLEILNFVHERKGQAKAVDLLDRLVEGAHFQLPYNPKINDGVGRSLFRRYEGLSLGDAMQVAYMQSQDLEYIYSFDDDFDAVDGVSRLATVDNPFV
jgi:predicted nucleic acid-binding protein